MAYIAHMKGILGKSPRVDYTPNPATGDEMRLAAMTPAARPHRPVLRRRKAPPMFSFVRRRMYLQRTAVDHRAARRVPARPAHR